MKIPALTMNDPEVVRVLRDGAEMIQDVECDATVFVSDVELGEHGPEVRHRPYLHITGEMRSLFPKKQLPAGVDEVTSRPNLGQRFDVFYEFDDDQIKDLVGKGYYRSDFEIPQIMSNTEYEFPVKADFLILHPEAEEDVPVVFVGVDERAGLVLDLQTSGYDLAEYFEQSRQAAAQRGMSGIEAQEEAETALHNDREINDVFEDDRFKDMHAAEEEMLARRNAAQPGFDEVENEDGFVDDHDQEVEKDAGTKDEMSLEDLYNQVINPYVEERLVPIDRSEHEAEPEPKRAMPVEEIEPEEGKSSGELKLSDFEPEETEVAPIETGVAPTPAPQGRFAIVDDDDREDDYEPEV